MASIFRKPRSPYWQAKIRGPKNKIISQTTKLTDKRQALKYANELEAQYREANKLAGRGELTQAAFLRIYGRFLEETTGEKLQIQSIESYFETWIQGKTANGITESTLKRYKPILSGFVDSLPDARLKASLASITPADVERFLHAEHKSGKSPQTSNFAVRVLRIVFNAARRKGVILSNPAEAVDLLPEEPDERIPFTVEQVRALLAAADPQWKGMILLGYHCGLRLGDAAGLSWANVDLNREILTFQAQKTARRKKGQDKNTVVCLHADLVSYFEALPTSDDPNAPLFPTLHEKPAGSRNGLSDSFRKLMVQARVHSPLGAAKEGRGRRFRVLGFHSLRHSFISKLANSGISADVRKELVGHSSDDIHRKYTHLDLSLQAAAIAQQPSVLAAA